MRQPQITGPITPTLVTGTTYDIDASGGNYCEILLDVAAKTGNVKNLQPGHQLVVKVTQDATGSRTFTWGSGAGIATVSAATAPGLAPASTANAITVFTLVGTAQGCTAALINGRAIV